MLAVNIETRCLFSQLFLLDLQEEFLYSPSPQKRVIIFSLSLERLGNHQSYMNNDFSKIKPEIHEYFNAYPDNKNAALVYIGQYFSI